MTVKQNPTGGSIRKMPQRHNILICNKIHGIAPPFVIDKNRPVESGTKTDAREQSPYHVGRKREIGQTGRQVNGQARHQFGFRMWNGAEVMAQDRQYRRRLCLRSWRRGNGRSWGNFAWNQPKQFALRDERNRGCRPRNPCFLFFSKKKETKKIVMEAEIKLWVPRRLREQSRQPLFFLFLYNQK